MDRKAFVSIGAALTLCCSVSTSDLMAKAAPAVPQNQTAVSMSAQTFVETYGGSKTPEQPGKPSEFVWFQTADSVNTPVILLGYSQFLLLPETTQKEVRQFYADAKINYDLLVAQARAIQAEADLKKQQQEAQKAEAEKSSSKEKEESLKKTDDSSRSKEEETASSAQKQPQSEQQPTPAASPQEVQPSAAPQQEAKADQTPASAADAPSQPEASVPAVQAQPEQTAPAQSDQTPAVQESQPEQPAEQNPQPVLPDPVELYRDAMEPNIALSLSGLKGEIAQDQEQQALNAFMESEGKPEFVTYFNTCIAAASPDYVTMRQDLKAVQTPDEVKLLTIDRTDDQTLVVTEYNTAVKSVDFAANTIDFGVKKQFAYTAPEQQEQAQPETASQEETVVAKAEPVKQETAQKAQPKQTGQKISSNAMYSQSANSFIADYCSNSYGAVYTAADSFNYKQILNGYSAWSAMSQEDKTSVNTLLQNSGSVRYQDLYMQANQIRIGLSNNSMGGSGAVAATARTASVKTAADSHRTGYVWSAGLFGMLAVFFGIKSRKETADH